MVDPDGQPVFAGPGDVSLAVRIAATGVAPERLRELVEAGVHKAVVNVHWFADRLESHLAARTHPAVVISDERAELLETGGGLKKARPLLGDDPVFVANIDSVWTDNGAPGDSALNQLARLWNPSIMDAALLLARREGSIGFEGGGDFFLAGDGRLTFRGEAAEAPFAYMGVHICRPDYVADGPEGPFSLSGFWRRSAAAGRLYGCVLDGDWIRYVYDADDVRPDPGQRYIVLTPENIDASLDRKATSYAAYVDQVFKRDAWDLGAGVRLERDGLTDETLVSPRLRLALTRLWLKLCSVASTVVTTNGAPSAACTITRPR